MSKIDLGVQQFTGDDAPQPNFPRHRHVQGLRLANHLPWVERIEAYAVGDLAAVGILLKQVSAFGKLTRNGWGTQSLTLKSNLTIRH